MDIDEALKEINEASYDIPFENSQFQTDKFVVGAQLTPARAYRAILLRLNNRIQALNEAKYSLAREDIDIEELEAKIAAEEQKKEQNSFDIRRWKLDIAQKRERRAYTAKLAHDAITEVNHLYSCFKRFPRYTREQFEAEEEKHFLIDLTRQTIGMAGARASLADMGHGANEIKDLDGMKPTKELRDLLEKPVDVPQITM